MKTTNNWPPHDFGCPDTEMRSMQWLFERAHSGKGLDFNIKVDAPHYSSNVTRIAFYEWEDANKKLILSIINS